MRGRIDFVNSFMSYGSKRQIRIEQINKVADFNNERIARAVPRDNMRKAAVFQHSIASHQHFTKDAAQNMHLLVELLHEVTCRAHAIVRLLWGVRWLDVPRVCTRCLLMKTVVGTGTVEQLALALSSADTRMDLVPRAARAVGRPGRGRVARAGRTRGARGRCEGGMVGGRRRVAGVGRVGTAGSVVHVGVLLGDGGQGREGACAREGRHEGGRGRELTALGEELLAVVRLVWRGLVHRRSVGDARGGRRRRAAGVGVIGGRRRVRRDGVQGVEDGYDELVMGRSLDGGGEGGPLGLEERERLCTTSHTLTARDSCTLRKSYPLNLAKNFCRMRQSVPRRTSPRVHIITYRPPFFPPNPHRTLSGCSCRSIARARGHAAR